MVLLLLNAILRLVCLKRLVIFLTLGLCYVIVAHFVWFLISLLFALWPYFIGNAQLYMLFSKSAFLQKSHYPVMVFEVVCHE